MRNVHRILGFVLAGALAAAPALAAAQQDGALVLHLELDGVVDPFVADYVQGGIDEAEERGAAAVLLTIDTPGGLVSSTRDITQAILNSRVPVICYVSPEGAQAASAGTFVLMSCPVAAMAPATNVGAAHPVGVVGAIESEKAENDAAEFLVSLAERRDRNAQWAERAVRESVSASAQEALELDVIDLVSPSVASLLGEIDGRTVEVAEGQTVTLDLTGAVLEPRAMGLGIGFLHTLLDPNIAFLFFWLGLAFVVLELFVPGGVLGTVGALMFVMSIVALGMLPVQLLGVVLLIASVVFFVLEIKHPGLGLPTAGGVVSLVLGGMFLFDPDVESARVSWWVLAPVAIFAGAFSTWVLRAAVKLWKRGPARTAADVVGEEGVAMTALAPSGVVQVAAEEWTAESLAGRIPKGTRVRVREIDGLRLKVEPAEQPAQVNGGSD